MATHGTQLPTRERAVTFVLLGGQEVRATVYLASMSPTHPGAETLEELLNASARFLPVRYELGGHALVRREGVLLVRAEPEARIGDEIEEYPLPSIDLVHVRLDGGLELDGVLARVDRAQSARLSDYFNGAALFFALEVSGGLVYVNKDHVVSLIL